MRLNGPSTLTCAARAALAAAALAAAPAFAQQSGGPSLEDRLRALEARVSALEGRAAAPGAPAAPAVKCIRLSVNGAGIAPGATLTVTVNGTVVGVFDGAASGNLEGQMRPGVNIVGLSFASPGTPGPFGTGAELRCLPPGESSSRNEILALKPTPGRLSAEVRVDLVRP